MADGKLETILKGHHTAIFDVGWSPDDRRIASSELLGLIKIWEPRTGNQVLTIPAHQSKVLAPIAWGPDGNRLLSGSDYSMKVWDGTPEH